MRVWSEVEGERGGGGGGGDYYLHHGRREQGAAFVVGDHIVLLVLRLPQRQEAERTDPGGHQQRREEVLPAPLCDGNISLVQLSHKHQQIHMSIWHIPTAPSPVVCVYLFGCVLSLHFIYQMFFLDRFCNFHHALLLTEFPLAGHYNRN